MRIVDWSREDLRQHIDRVIDIYCAAMGYPKEVGRQRKGYVIVHTQREGFRAVAATDESDGVVGFAYGYRGTPGQWWHDEVRRALTKQQIEQWLADPFELCELHVRPDRQGHGLGQEMLTRLLRECPHQTVVLSTPEGESRAWRLYRRMGFVDIRRNHRFAGDDRPFAVLGRPLPLDVDTTSAGRG
jgi:ribosomal protein S18 acetylase RimI-like enzyme